ncbi:MAG: rhodanese-like domain-containing protein [Phycisphaerales bacterium]
MSRRKVLQHTGFTVLLLLLTVPIACQTEPKVTDKDLEIIGVDEVATLIESEGADLVVVDPRTDRRYAEAHIPGALSLPLEQAAANDPRLVRAKTIVVYGGPYDDPVAIAMTKKLLALRYKDVSFFQGGLEEWVSHGHPVRYGVDDRAEP